MKEADVGHALACPVCQARFRGAAECSRCGADLKEQHAEHVRIDECPECGGIWLDKGELDQLRRVNRARGVSGGVLGSLFRRG